jgi:hypothetical protein
VGSEQLICRLPLKVSCDFGELSEGGLEIFDDFGGKDITIRKIADLTIQQCNASTSAKRYVKC